MSLGSKIFSFKRVSINKEQTIICISNLSSKIQRVNLNKIYHNWKNLIGPKIKINFDTKIALCGSKCEVKLNNNKIETGKTISIKSGDVLDIKKCINANRVYLGFSAKMKLKKTFNSKSTYDKIQIGGLNGKKLLKNYFYL